MDIMGAIIAVAVGFSPALLWMYRTKAWDAGTWFAVSCTWFVVASFGFLVLEHVFKLDIPTAFGITFLAGFVAAWFLSRD